MVLPPTSGRPTPEVNHVHSKERECRMTRMNRRWMQPNLQDTSVIIILAGDGVISLASFRDVIPKQGVKGARQKSITFIVGSQAVTKHSLHSCATRALGMRFTRRVMVLAATRGRLTPEFMHQLWSIFDGCHETVFQRCGYSCKDVQTSRLTVRSCSPLHCHCLTDTHTGAKRNSLLFLAFGPKFWRSRSPKTHRCAFEGVGVHLMKVDLQYKANWNWTSKIQASL